MNSIVTSIEATAASTTAGIVSGTSKTLVNVAKAGGVLGAAALVGFGIFKAVQMVKKSNAETAALEAETERIHSKTEKLVKDSEKTVEGIRATTEELIRTTEQTIDEAAELKAKVEADKAAKAEQFNQLRQAIIEEITKRGLEYPNETAEQTAERWITDARETLVETNEKMLRMSKIAGNPHVLVGEDDLNATAAQVVFMNIGSYISNDRFELVHEDIQKSLDSIDADVEQIMADHSTDKAPEMPEAPELPTYSKEWYDSYTFGPVWEHPGTPENQKVIERFRDKIAASMIAVSFEIKDEEGNEMESVDIVKQIAKNLAATRLQMVKIPENRESFVAAFIAELYRVAKYSHAAETTISSYAIDIVECVPAWIDDGKDLIQAIQDWDRPDDIEVADDAIDGVKFRGAVLKTKQTLRNDVNDIIKVVTADIPKKH